jgi:YidC/Oxa1 family membrane protein insertase
VSALWNGLLELLAGILAFFYELIPVYGISIILLTLFIGLLMFPLTLKQTRSMKAMQDIQPEVKRLQKELKEDREQLNKELMALYQERGVNPAAGCLPLLVQMPIWFALFRVLRTPIDFIAGDTSLASALSDKQTSFLGMSDLLISPSEAIADGIWIALPYLVAILLVVATGYYQQAQMTRNRTQAQQDQQQQSMQTVMKVMPLMFGLFSWAFPGGLIVYFIVSQLFRIGQQSLIMRMDDDGDEPSSKASSATPPPEDGNDQKTAGPSPHASKKKKKRRRK